MSTVTTFAAPSTRPRRGGPAVDAVIASAVDVARDAALEVAGPDQVGAHEGVRLDGHRVATHYFASTARGYRGWRWAVTLARAPRAKTPTVCEVALLAGEEAIVAPAWLPWSERLQPRDVGRDDVLPYSPDDPRLMPGYAATGDADADQVAIYELGLGRARVLSPEGRAEASERWYSGVHGPVTPPEEVSGRSRRQEGRVPPAQCSTCGFLLLMAGSMRTLFGVCANEWSPDDGQVVSMDHGCGAHSETDVLHGRGDWPDNAPVVDDLALEVFGHEVPERGGARGVPERSGARAVPESGEAQAVVEGDEGPVVPDEDQVPVVRESGEAQVVAEGDEGPVLPDEDQVPAVPDGREAQDEHGSA